MATIYRFVVEQGTGKGSGGRKSGGNSKKKTGKTTTLLKMMTDNKGGVEHNRKLRAINPLVNRMTNGYWEKGMRIGRAGLGLVKFKKNAETGALQFAGLSSPAIAIIIAFLIQTTIKHHQKLMERADRENKLNYKSMEVGTSNNHGNYNVAVNVWSGKISYNENK